MTTYATDTFPGDGSKVEFDPTFKFIERDHVTVSRVVKATQLATVLTVIKTGTPTGDEFIWESDTKIKVGTAPTAAEELVIARDTPENDQIVKWADGSYIVATDLNTSDLQWLYGLQELEDKFGKLSTTAIKYFGAIDLTVDKPPASPVGGTFYINTGSGSVLAEWTGIGGDAVVGSEQVVYNDNINEWQIFQVPSSQTGVIEVKVTDPITRDVTDPQKPVIGVKASSPTQDGSMSKADKEKLDALPDKATGINLGYTAAADKGTVTNTAGTDATIPFATSTNAGLLNEAATPGSGTVQYARQVTNAGVASWAQVAIPPGTIINDTEPATPADGQLWYRPSNSTLWVWDNGNSTWQPAMEPVPTGGGAKYADGDLPEKGFFENVQEITEDYTITSGSNAFSAGPITIKSGTTVTVGTSETWTVAGGGDGILWQRDGTTLKPVNAGDDIQSGGNPNGGTAAGVRLNKDGNVQACASADNFVFFGLAQGTATPTILMRANGQITAAGTVQSGGNPDQGTAKGVRLNIDGNVQACAAADKFVFFGLSEGTTSPTIAMRANGSITAADTITLGSMNTDADAIGTRVFQTGGILFRNDSDNSSALQIFNGGSSDTNRTVQITAGGNITAAGNVTINGGTFIANSDTGGWAAAVYANAGVSYFTSASRAGDVAICTGNGSGNVIGVYVSGGTGKVSFPNGTAAKSLELWLEPDNPDAWQTKEKSYEEQITGPLGNVEKTVTKTREVKEYVGKILDVRSELQALRARATQQDAVIAQLVTALRSQGVTIDTTDIQEGN